MLTLFQKGPVRASLFLFLFLLLGCGGKEEIEEGVQVRRIPQGAVYSRFQPPEVQKQRAEFIIRCARAANPMSDEEPEDLVAACRSAAESVYVSSKTIYQYRTRSDTSSSWRECWEAAIGTEEWEACRQHGYEEENEPGNTPKDPEDYPELGASQ